MAGASPPQPDARARLTRRALRLEYVTIVWNALEGVAAIAAGIVAHSVALTAFGLDSSVEVFASSVAAWQLRAPTGGRDRTALRLIGASFLLVAVYVAIQSVSRLISREHAAASPFGMVITAAAAVVMSALGVSKRGLARRLSNAVLTAEAKFSLVDAGLSGTVLVGLILDSALGWWWADPVVAMVIALFAFSEAAEGLRA